MLICVICGDKNRTMMNKRLKLWIAGCLGCLACLGLAGCADGELPGGPGPAEGEGEPVALSFRLCRLTAGEASTRADAATDMEDGKTIRIYAFPAGGSTTASQPLDSKIYTVQGGVATGELYLYRGTYDLYLVSYNSSTEAPELQADGTIQVSNGKDFMYATLKGIVVQPNQTGENHMNVTLPNPFRRMGAQVQVTVAAKNGSQPVAISSLKANTITVGGLRPSMNYTLGASAWTTDTDFTSSYTYERFTRANNNYTTPWVSTPEVMLPVDGSAYLTFIVNLTVGYDGTKSFTGDYTAEIQKVLLPGMTYKFDFTLTFYGELEPMDLTLAVKEYNTVTLVSDGLGGD